MSPAVQARLSTLRKALDALEAELASDTANDTVAATTGLPTPLAWGAKVSPTFRDRVRWIGEDLGFDPSWLMACMAFETGRRFTADVKNPQSTATGLIQFMAATAKGLGTTTAKLAAMTPEDQLNWVWRYFKPYKGKIGRLADCYMAILNPVAIGKPDSSPMWVRGSSAYAVNAGLDSNKDQQITKAEAAAKVAAMLADGFKPENAA